MGNAFCVQFGHITAFRHVDCRTINYTLHDSRYMYLYNRHTEIPCLRCRSTTQHCVLCTLNFKPKQNNKQPHKHLIFLQIRIHSLTSGRSHSQIWEAKHLRPLNSCIRHLTYKKTKNWSKRKIQYKYLVTAFRKRTKRPEVIPPPPPPARTEQSTNEIVQNPTWHWLLINHNKYIFYLYIS